MQQFISHKYIKINPAQRHSRFFMHNILRKYHNQQIFQYSKSIKTSKNNGRHNEDHGMRRDVQRMPKSREKSARKTHNMT
jgi:hypothetical protein